MSKHTHRGTCQVCGAQQAVNNETGMMAKHGYTVEHGFFEGECPGSHNLPLEHDHTMTDNIIGDLTRQAERIQKRIDDGIKHVTITYEVGERYNRVKKKATVTADTVEQVFAEIGKRFYSAEYQWDELVEREIWMLKRQIIFLVGHCDMMTDLIAKRHGADLFPVERIERIAKDFADHADAHEWVQSMKADGWKGRITINRNVSFGHPQRNTAQLRRTV